MKLYFARHGESEANLLRVISNRGNQFGLTPQGRRQAAILAQSLKAVPVTAIYSSPLLRAVETADILARELHQSVQVTEALREYDCGSLEGKSDDENWQTHHAIAEDWVSNKNWLRKPDDGESFVEIHNRFVPFIEHLTHAGVRGDGRIVLIGHGGLFQLMLPLVFTNIITPSSEHMGSATQSVSSRSNNPMGLCVYIGVKG
jgi:broad specificity phosphatase PhoE